MKIVVDVTVGFAVIVALIKKGHAVVHVASDAEEDDDWLLEGVSRGAEVVISADKGVQTKAIQLGLAWVNPNPPKTYPREKVIFKAIDELANLIPIRLNFDDQFRSSSSPS